MFRAIQIDQPSFVLSREMLLKPMTYKRQVEAYRAHVVGVAWALAKAAGSAHVTKTEIAREVEEMLEFETKLSSYFLPQFYNLRSSPKGDW
ncbi:unnamed protein product, partial [Nesidiocoris tenuis]